MIFVDFEEGMTGYYEPEQIGKQNIIASHILDEKSPPQQQLIGHVVLSDEIKANTKRHI